MTDIGTGRVHTLRYSICATNEGEYIGVHTYVLYCVRRSHTIKIRT